MKMAKKINWAGMEQSNEKKYDIFLFFSIYWIQIQSKVIFSK
jgi:hypothetical protein